MMIEAYTFIGAVLVGLVCIAISAGERRSWRLFGAYALFAAYLAINQASLGWPTHKHLPDRFTLWAYTDHGIVISTHDTTDQRFYGGNFPPELKKMLEQAQGPLTFGLSSGQDRKDGVPVEMEGQKYDAAPLMPELKIDIPQDFGPSYTPSGEGGHPGGH